MTNAGPFTSMTFADGNVLASRRVPITTIVINRPELKNALMPRRHAARR